MGAPGISTGLLSVQSSGSALFMSNGFGDCYPVLRLNGTRLKSKYLGILIAATGIDTNGVLVSISICSCRC